MSTTSTRGVSRAAWKRRARAMLLAAVVAVITVLATQAPSHAHQMSTHDVAAQPSIGHVHSDGQLTTPADGQLPQAGGRGMHTAVPVACALMWGATLVVITRWRPKRP